MNTLDTESQTVRDLLRMPAAVSEVADSATWCIEYMALRASCAPRVRGQRLAAVFDIDDTLVRHDARVEEVCDIYEQCKILRITPFIITARSEKGRGYTEEQMQNIGITGYKRLFMHPTHERRDMDNAGRIKARHRDDIASHGFVVVFNAGDAVGDHFHPPPHCTTVLRASDRAIVFVDDKGVVHLKLKSDQ